MKSRAHQQNVHRSALMLEADIVDAAHRSVDVMRTATGEIEYNEESTRFFTRHAKAAEIAHFRRNLASAKATGVNPAFYEYKLNRLGARPELDDLVVENDDGVMWWPI